MIELQRSEENMAAGLVIFWCNDQGRASEVARFFAANVTPEYISHSELQGDRAQSPNEWRNDLPAVLRREVELRLHYSDDYPPLATSQPVAVAEQNGVIIALALVTFVGDAPIPFAIVEDLIVARDHRKKGIGKVVMDWIVAEALARGVSRLFLESGKNNHSAHHFFEREGFEICSIVMMRSLVELG
jgi:GNAT superfamily N-acetyltransferase